MATPQPSTPGDRREDYAQQVAATVAAVFAQAELVVLATIATLAKRVAAGGFLPAAAGRRLSQTSSAVFGAAIQRAAATYGPAWEALGPSLEAAVQSASTAAEDALTAAVTAAVAPPSTAATGPVVAVSPFRAAVDRAIASTRGGLPATSLSLSRVQAAQKALDDLASQGLTGFVDKAGRRWDLVSYVEMATRTAVSNAWDERQAAALIRAGIDLVLVGTHSTEGSCPRCLPWLGRTLSLAGATPDYPTLADAKAAGFRHPNCFPGEVLVSAPSGVDAAYAHWYEGDLVVIHTASGDELPVTPNHPIATPEGWVAACQLVVGQSVLRYGGGNQRVGIMGPGDEQVPARISEVFDALRESSPVGPVRMPAAPEQFHGDGGGSDVDVVLSRRLLERHWDAECFELPSDSPLIVGASGLRALLADGSLDQLILGARHASHGGVSSAGQVTALLRGHGGKPAPVSLASAYVATCGHDLVADGIAGHVEASGYLGDRASFVVQADGLWLPRLASQAAENPSSLEAAIEGDRADADLGRKFADLGPGVVAPDQVVQVERRQFAGHVYNLQAGDGWYVASSIVVHNCRCSWAPVGAGIAAEVTNPVDVERAAAAYKASQRQRALERRVRAAHRRTAAAATPAARAKARRDLRAAQTAADQHRQRSGVVMTKASVRRRQHPFEAR